MKLRKGLLTILIIVMVVVVVGAGAATLAFYYSGRAAFSFVVGSESGAEIALALTTSSGSLVPAQTNAGVQNYSVSNYDTQEEYAGFVILCRCLANTADVDFTITDVSYTKNGSSLSSALSDYLDDYIEYTIIFQEYETSGTTYTDGNSSLLTIAQITALSPTWYDVSSSTTTSAWSISGIKNTSQYAKSYLHVYVRFKSTISQELLPEDLFNGVTISFTVASDIIATT